MTRGGDERTVELVRGLVHGGWKARALAVTLRLGIPDRLGEGALPLRELAASLHASEDGLRRLLRLMIALGLFNQERTDVYRNNAASGLLRSDHPRKLWRYAMLSLAGDAAVEGPLDELF